MGPIKCDDCKEIIKLKKDIYKIEKKGNYCLKCYLENSLDIWSAMCHNCYEKDKPLIYQEGSCKFNQDVVYNNLYCSKKCIFDYWRKHIRKDGNKWEKK